MCFAHEDGAREAWQSYDITPATDADGQITTFDVTESNLHLVLAVSLPAGTRTKVFTSVCKKTEFNPPGSYLYFLRIHSMRAPFTESTSVYRC